jgi:hypothetical protein
LGRKPTVKPFRISPTNRKQKRTDRGNCGRGRKPASPENERVS